MSTHAAPRSALKTAILVGLGAIGSHLASLLVRLPGLGQLVLVDGGRYSSANLTSQDITAASVGQPKASEQASRLRQINPQLDIEAIDAYVETVPLGQLRADVILTGLDTRKARAFVNDAAWRLNVPWINSAVSGADWLVKVEVFVPGPESPCLLCTWDEADFAAVEQTYPCQSGANIPTTGAPASLAAMAAGLAATECEKILNCDMQHLLAGRELMLDLRHHTHFVTCFRRNMHCRFGHDTWDVQRIAESPNRMSISRLLDIAGYGVGNGMDWHIRLQGHQFVCKQVCTNCKDVLAHPACLAERLPQGWQRCPRCGGIAVRRGFDMFESLEPAMLAADDYGRRLSSLGFRGNDIVTIHGPKGRQHFELGGTSEGEDDS